MTNLITNKNKLILIAIFMFVIVFSYTILSAQSKYETIKIGASLPLTGPVGLYGKWSLQGMILAVDEINLQGGINGKKLELIVEDDKCNGKEGIGTINKLINVDGVKSLIIYCGAVTGAVADLIGGKALTYSISVRTESLEGKYPFLFNMAPSPEKETEFLAKYIHSHGIENVAIIHQSDYFGETYKNKFRKAFTDLEGNITVEGSLDNFANPDFRTDLLKAKQTNTQAIFTSFNPAQYSEILKQSKELGLNVGFFSAWNTQSQLFLDLTGNLSERIVYSYSFKESQNEKYQSFKERYQNLFNETPEANAANGYDAIILMAGVMKKCGDGVECMTEETTNIRDFSGMSGTFGFVENVADKDIYLKTIEDGKFLFIAE